MKKYVYNLKKNPLFILNNLGFSWGKLVFVMACVAFSLSAKAIDKQTVASITDQDLVLSGPYELHITNATAPFTNSTVSLNHEDAWLFFDNIKPSVVIANYLPSILINGNAISVGTNARVAIYAHGTVVMPHSASFMPLTVYNADNFGGTSLQFSINSYYTSLGSFDNAIKSFKLKRGYMATLATKADGGGYSRVFVATDNDLEVSAMPELLNGTVSFIRVFKHEYVTKKGWCQTGGSAASATDMINGTWFYSWSADQASTNNSEYVPIKQNGGWPGWDQINSKLNVTQLLGFNEPDHTEQSNLTVDQAIAAWPSFMNSGLRLGAPATTNFNWLYSFIDKCNALNYRVDYVAVHAYWGSSASSFYNTLKYVHERTGRPIWITEWNYGANWTSEYWPEDPANYTTANAQWAYDHIKPVVDMFDTCHFVERYSIYNWVEDARAIILNGSLTKAGQYYAADKSKIAFQRINEVVPTYTYLVPTLSYIHFYTTTLNQIKLTWADANGELSRGYKLERRINDGSFETIYESSNLDVLSYFDNIQSTISGRISYKLSLKTAYGTYVSSNEVSYYQGGGTDNVQTGNLLLNNSDWSLCIFSQKYSASPLVYLGIPSLNNGFPMTNRVKSIGTRSFYFHLDPWAYLNNPTLSATDKLAFMALPGGIYNFGGLKAEAVKISTPITDTWQAITFPEAFTKTPVVFCTQTSSTASFPTAIAVRNVTTTGFELRLLKEAALAVTFPGDNVNYFAIEPGTGVIAGRRVTVGMTDGNTVGGSYNPVVITADATYTQPALFAGLQTAADDITSTLRYSSYVANTYNVIKTREISTSTANVAKDQLGWMVMDLAPDQVITATLKTASSRLAVYPNPAVDVVYLNLDKPTNVTIYDMFGRVQFNGLVINSVDVSMLPFGTYLLVVDGAEPVKLIKK